MKNKIIHPRTIEDYLYIVSLIILICILIYLILKAAFPDFLFFKLPCFIKYYTGFCCPSCGGTRSFYAFIHGNFLASFVWNPAAFYAFVYYIVFFLSHSLRLLTKNKIKGLNFKFWHLFIGIALIIINMTVKNILHIYGITLY